MRNYEEVAERVFRRGDEMIRRNKRRRRVMLGVCSSAACLAAVIAVSYGEWTNSRRSANLTSDIDLSWSPASGSANAEQTTRSAAGASEASTNNTLTDLTGTAANGETNVNLPNQALAMFPPVDGVIVQMMYGYGGYAGHNGIDIKAPLGTPVHAAADGVVSEAVGDMEECTDGRGLYVVIEHDNGLATSYCHLSAVGVSPGQRVAAGDVIGEVGSSGEALGELLHFEVRQGVDGTPLNPVDLPPQYEYVPDAEDSAPDGVPDHGVVGVSTGVPVRVTTVIDKFDTGSVASYAAPENGSVTRSEPLNEAMRYYGDKDEYGEDIIYYLRVDFFKDGELIDPGDPVIREDEWNRLDGLPREFMTASADWGELNTHYVLLRLTKPQIESFAPSDGLGYIFYLVDEDGNGPVSIDRDVIHLPVQEVDDGIRIASETDG